MTERESGTFQVAAFASHLTGAGTGKPVVSHSAPFAFPARKQLPKRTIEDTVEEQNEDKGRAAKKRKKEEGEGPG